jgi:hypothetical protein
MRDKGLRGALAGVVIFAIGIAIAAGTYETYWKNREAREQLLSAEGTVVAVLGQGTSVRPVVSFVSNAGDHLSFTGKQPGRYSPGNRVHVLYPPANPDAAIVDDPGHVRAKTILPTLGGLLVAVLGAYIAWFARRTQLSSPHES